MQDKLSGKANKASLIVIAEIIALSIFILYTNVFFRNIFSFYIPNIFIYFIDCAGFLYITNLYKDKILKLVKRIKNITPIIENIFIGGLYAIFLYQLLPNFSIIHCSSTVKNTLLFALIVAGYFLFILKSCDKPEPSTVPSNNFRTPLIVLSVLFVLIKLCTPIFFTGSFIDEYSHIFSGIDFWNSGRFSQFNIGLPYTRGEYVSVIVGLFLKIFGYKILVAKMVPALMGIINYFILYKILKIIKIDKKWLFLTLLIYTISPLVIFNHFYIRVYVFYEYFLLSNSLITLKIIKNDKKRTTNFLLLVFNNLILLLFSNDPGAYFPALAACIPMIYIYYNFNWAFRNLSIKNKFLKYVTLNKKIRGTIILFSLIAAYFLLNGQSKVNSITSGILQFSSSSINYYTFFANSNVTISIFFIISILAIPFFKTSLEKVIALVACTIFFIHINQNQGIQIIRGLLYFLPIFYLISILAISKINFNKTKMVLVYIIIILTIIFNYSGDFLKGPYIPAEIKYTDYAKAYLFLNVQCANSNKYAILNEPYISKFYNAHIDYTTYIIPQFLYDDTNFVRTNNGTFKNFYGNIQTITDPQFFNNIKYQNVCIIISNSYLGNGKFISNSDFNDIGKYFKKREFEFLNVYYK